MIDYKELINRYLKVIEKLGEPDEAYKYEAIQHFQDHWNINSKDFFAMFKKAFAKKRNLFYQNSWGFIEKSAKHFPEFTKTMFIDLYNENTDLEERIIKFKKQSEEVLIKIRKKLNRQNINAQQDERTLSVYLTFKYPEKYIFYLFKLYKKIAEEFNLPNSSNKNYIYLLSILADFKSEIKNSSEFLNNYRKLYPQPNWNDENLMVQNILYVSYLNNLELLNKDSDEELFKSTYKNLKSNRDKFYSILDQLKTDLDLISGDSRTTFSVPITKTKLNFIIGQRLIWRLHNHNYTFLFIAKSNYTKKYENFGGTKDRFLNYTNDFSLVQEKYLEILECAREEIKKTNKSSYAESNNKFFENSVFNLEYRNTISDIQNTDNKLPAQMHALNQILYGPPGTGKTYNTINKAISIANPEFDLEQDRNLIKEEYSRLVEEGQIVFTTFHQSMSYEEFIEGIKPLKPEVDDEFVKYDVHKGIFKEISLTANQVEIAEDNFDVVYQQLLKEIDSSSAKSIILETLVRSKEFTIYKNSKNNLKFHANTEKAYEGVIRKEIIEHYLKTGEALDWSSYTKAVAQYITEKFNFNQKIKEHQKKNFVLIIDEINRGNVSQIFGELITLIEEDKRIGNSEELQVMLPYSKEKFGVPPNLYIIGTMNTADRSVEALDSALRRRFVFEEMPPLYHLEDLQDEVYGFKLSDILKRINLRIEKLLDSDHSIGHAYFLHKDENSIIKSFYKNIIPLLKEYFFGDHGKIGLVLGNGFVQKIENDSVFADFEYDGKDQYDEKESYTIIDHSDNKNAFEIALSELMK